MSKAIQRFSLDVTHPDVQASVRIMQGDDNREWRFTFTEAGRPFDLPARCTAMLVGTKPDDTVLENGLVVKGNEVIYDFGAADPNGGIEQISTVPGSFEVQILLFDEYGAVLHAPRLWVTVFSSSYTERMANVSMDQFGGIKELIARLVGMEGDVETLLERMTGEGSVTVATTDWTDATPYTALINTPGIDRGQVILFMPNDDATKTAAGAARLSMQISYTNADTDLVQMIRASAGTAPLIPLNFRYLILRTGTEEAPLVSLVGVDAVGEGGGGSSGGGTGQDGFSPVAHVSKVGNAATISITDKSGTTTATVYDGEKGDKGDQGIQGVQGVQGIQGEKGDPGATGATGAKGDKGDPGEPFAIAKVYPSIDAMRQGYATDGVGIGQFVVIETGDVADEENARLYIKGNTEYEYLTDLSGAPGMQGPKGPQGETGATGAKGDKGDQGIQGVQGVQGIQGEKGDPGATGATGAAGKSAYQIWLDAGNTGTEADFLESLKGEDGKDAEGVGYTVPDYWKTEVSEVVTRVKALQDAGGRDVVNFAWFSDVHWHPDDSQNRYMENVGVLAASVMDQCNIPLALMNGDSLTAYAAGMPTEDVAISLLKEAMEMYAPIGYDRLMLVRGNHDDVYGKYETVNYVGKAAPAKVWNALHRPQAEDFRRVFGGDGTYFYLDNIPQKVRFICLNSHFYDGVPIYTGTYSQQTTGFGDEQIEWFEKTALVVDDGWGIVITMHVPPTAKSVNGNTYYLGQYSDGTGTKFRTIVNANPDNIIAIFCGHCHADAVVTGDLPCPIITVTSVVNTPYDGTAADRVLGTSDETAFDIVSINKKTKIINTTRVGYGSDRSVSYGEGELATYTVTYNLTNCTSSNSAVTVTEGASYSATIAAKSGYVLDSVTCTMGGSAVTVTGGVISIASVTGDIIITAAAVEEAGGDEPGGDDGEINILTTPFVLNGTSYAAIGYENDVRLSTSSGTTKADTSVPDVVTFGYIPVYQNQVVHVKGVGSLPSASANGTSVCRYSSSKAFLSGTGITNGQSWNNLSFANTDDGFDITIGSSVEAGTFIRICVATAVDGANCSIVIEGATAQ